MPAETLEEFGYRAVASRPAAALEAFRADPLAFDAVLTDERLSAGELLASLARAQRRGAVASR